MGASPSAPEEPPPPPRGESPSWLPYLGALGHRPPPRPPVPELPDEIERMIHAYPMLERDRKRRVDDVLEFSDRRLHMHSTKRWSLREFCQLVDHEAFQGWLINEYLEDNPEKVKPLIDAVEQAYSWYKIGRRNVSPEFLQELTTRYEPVMDEKRKNGFNEYGGDRRQELLRMLEAMRYLCQDSEIVGTDDFDRMQYYDPRKGRIKYRFKFH